MSYCRNCGAKLGQGDRFCSECGSAVYGAGVETGAGSATESHRTIEEISSAQSPPAQQKPPAAQVDLGALLKNAATTIQNTPVVENLSSALLNPTTFVLLYTVVMIPTYILPYFGSNSNIGIINYSLGVTRHVDVNPALYVHIAVLAVLVFITWLRGRIINKGWLLALPIAASCFDLFPGLSMIPMVPTILHVTTIIIGVKDDQRNQAR